MRNSIVSPLPGLLSGRLSPLADTAQDGGLMPAGMRPHVLVVDDESLIADSVAAILNRNGYDAVARYTGVAAVQYLDVRKPDIVVTDVVLPDLDGVRLALSIRAICPDVRVVLFSGSTATVNLLELAASEGNSFELLSKPVHPAVLLKALRES